MTSYRQHQRNLVGLVVGGWEDGVDDPAVLPRLKTLLKALPHYGNPAVEAAHRGVLSTVLEVSAPNDRIAAQPDETGWGYYTSYAYRGPYSGYGDAFFPGRTTTSAAAEVVASVREPRSGWWRDYALTVLTDAARQSVSLSLDTGRLTADLATAHAELLPALTATYLSTLRHAYEPTASALAALAAAGEVDRARAELGDALSSGAFTANVDQAIAMGGDDTNAVVWLLYNTWTTLKALDCPNVDATIRTLQAGGLTVPAQVGPRRWWDGGYTTWYHPLAGPDLATGALTAGMPQTATTSFSPPPTTPPTSSAVTTAGGYSQSLCLWGPLNRYRPRSSSCLGTGTGVLMADGSVKPVQDVRIGDAVRSPRGTGKVVLVERPARRGRVLHSINGLDVRATSGHPFRLDGPGPARAAVDPWCLVDEVPTMIADGVAALVPGVVLAGSVTVREVTPHEPEGGDDEPVYDLVVDDGHRGHAAYYVGGPDTFLVVDSETADPLHHVAATLGVVAAMEVALDAVRDHVPDPHTALPALLSRVDLTGAPPTTGRPPIPGPDLYHRDGEWDPHASALESHLVRRFGRVFRRHRATAPRPGPASPDDRFVVHVRDVELLGDTPLTSSEVVVDLVLRGEDQAGDRVRRVVVGTDGARWHLTPDAAVDFGAPAWGATLAGTLRTGDAVLGAFRATATEGEREHFLFSPGGTVVGRVAVDQLLTRPAERARAWSERDARAAAVDLGRHLGQQLVDLVRPPR
ncbi:hypothetical protein [Umezawaea sp.]|uniref:hypothetical protein n=1 Tax=Umezawaea sp. TaxID=1955258 RepID=UPI002ED68639